MGQVISREQYEMLLIEITELKRELREKDKLIDTLRLFRPIDPRTEYVGD